MDNLKLENRVYQIKIEDQAEVIAMQRLELEALRRERLHIIERLKMAEDYLKELINNIEVKL